jgi:hypothetical protein
MIAPDHRRNRLKISCIDGASTHAKDSLRHPDRPGLMLEEGDLHCATSGEERKSVVRAAPVGA